MHFATGTGICEEMVSITEPQFKTHANENTDYYSR
jgi:hypothetical protein